MNSKFVTESIYYCIESLIMNKILLAAGIIFFAVLMIMLFIDTLWAKKIWMFSTVLISAVSVCTIPFPYTECMKSISKSILQYDMKIQWMADYKRFFVTVIIMLVIYIVFIAAAYVHHEKHKNDNNTDNAYEYVVLFVSAMYAIAVHILAVSFSVLHQVKGYDISYYAVSVTTAVISVIIINSLMYMKLTQ